MKCKNMLALLALCLCAGLLAGCSKEEPAPTEAPAEEPAEAESEGEELQEYAAEGVGVYYLPAGWEMEVGSSEDPLPQTYADFTNGDLHIHSNRFGMDAYEAAGVPLPADVEEFSQRDGVRRSVPEDAEFAYDEFGNYYTEFTQDGAVTYYVLKQGEECMGDAILTYPEGTELPEGIYEWLSQATLE